VNLSNDAWLGSGPGPEQHLAMVALRAIENRTWVVRATTTGISAIIDPFGRVVVRAPSDRAEVLSGTIVPLRIETVYKRFGDAFAYACLLASVVVVALAWSARRSGSPS
jgi:apolipoprotein N-acyltransferase